jgi:hypothetical protein
LGESPIVADIILSKDLNFVLGVTAFVPRRLPSLATALDEVFRIKDVSTELTDALVTDVAAEDSL